MEEQESTPDAAAAPALVPVAAVPMVPAEPETSCALCQQRALLKSSHIIPNSYFKQMKEGGKLVRFDWQPNTAVITAQDSWQEHLLCESCEGQFSKLEARWIGNLRKADASFAAGIPVVNLPDFDFDSFKTFLLSILWRAAISTHERLSDIMLTAHDREELRSALHRGSTAVLDDWSIEIHKIVDKQKILELEYFMLAPMNRSERGQLAYRFIFGGYLIDFKFRPKAVGRGVLRDAPGLPLQSIAMTDVPEVMHAGVIAIDKDRRGLDRRIKK